jgi:hypothetical protein
MSQSEPRMKAIAANTKCSWRISAAAIRFPIRPATEIAFGVSRDSISRLRASVRISEADNAPVRPFARARRVPWSSPSLTR